MFVGLCWFLGPKHSLAPFRPGEPSVSDFSDAPPMLIGCGHLFDLPPFVCILSELFG